MQVKTVVLAAALTGMPCLLQAQFDFKIGGRDVQIHSFASQGFAYSDHNNYLTMDTSKGSFAFTDFGFNVSTRITDNFRVGAQFYDRNVGKLGNWAPTVDWASADYRFKDWFGVRGGKVKTVLGLYNDTQDMEFLHTWALVPQSTYPIDQRGETIAHIGGDIYGEIALKQLGGLSYTAYAGLRPDDMQGGFVHAMETAQKVDVPGQPMPTYIPADPKSIRKMTSYHGPVIGGDLRWTTPLKGLLAGASYIDQDLTAHGSYVVSKVPFTFVTDKDHTQAYYSDYSLGNLRINAEYRRQIRFTRSSNTAGVLSTIPNSKDSRFGYISAAYRISKWLEIGTYHSRFYFNWAVDHNLPGNHIIDQAVTARFDLGSHLDLKAEEHFMDGEMESNSTNRGFYPVENSAGLQPKMKLFVLRLGYHF